MQGEIFYWIFNMSIIASVMGLIVLVLRKLRFIPHRVSVFLWIIPFIRMCIPFGINSRYSLMTLISRFTTRTITVYEPAEGIAFSYSNTLRAANSYFPITYKVNILDTVFKVAGSIWIVVALSILISLGILYFSTIHEVRDAKLLEKNIYLSDKVTSPAVYGIIRPRIILPEPYAAGDLKYVLLHERTHIRRLDNLWRLLGFMAAAIHWFNPLSWVFLKVFLSDLELACDEQAVARCNEQDRKEYAHTLLKSASSKSLFVSAFGGAKVRTRIENILSQKPMTVLSSVGFTALIAAILYALLTNAG
ncbi:MAG: M56 family metallopeptidase [Clostridiales bacterium]|nr:M56 family metallopeptidase [Clostridiales bacterium]